MIRLTVLSYFALAWLLSGMSSEAAEPPLKILVPGFSVSELPVKLTSLNNIEYAADGRLFAGGYDGRFHLLRDTDGDGLEDKVDTFSSETTSNYPLGVAVSNGMPYFVLTDEVIRFVDTDQDGIPDKRETVATHFDDKTLKDLRMLHQRRVDSSMAIAIGSKQEIYITMGNAGYSNPYWHDDVLANGKKVKETEGEPQYRTDRRRGCLLRIHPDGTIEQLNSGLRYIMSMQFNKHGDLFATDQEGATWSPNGNPFDELLHLEEKKHYGFPPRHPRWLPDVVDEPSVWDYAPQHQSTCGFRFNGPSAERARFGPEFWAEDAIVTGESRGKLWRTSLFKTSAGYVAVNKLFGSVPLLVVDCAISPAGELVVCCHTGKPDWGNGPQGEGRIFKIRYNPKSLDAQPIAAFPISPTQSMIVFDRPLNAQQWKSRARHVTIEAGHYVAAADRFETMRPGYAIVQLQQKQRRSTLPVSDLQFDTSKTAMILTMPTRTESYNYAIALPSGIDLAHDLSGVVATWTSDGGAEWNGWLPQLNLGASKYFLRGSRFHDPLWDKLKSAGRLRLQGQLNLWQVLTPAVQPRAKLGYELQPEEVTVFFRSDAKLKIAADGAKVVQVNESTVEVTWTAPDSKKWLPFTGTLSTPASRFEVTYRTHRDQRERAIPSGRCLVPFAQCAPEIVDSLDIPQLAGGNYQAGHQLFKGKAACATCHQFRGEGVQVGADLGNVVHRDYESVLRDLLDPNATINPDTIGYTALLESGKAINGTRIAETDDELQLATPGGKIETIRKSDLESLKPMQTSLMPAGLDKTLSKEEIRDLMTYLLTEPKE